MLTDYIVKRNHTYHYRRRVPVDVQRHVGTQWWKQNGARSLHLVEVEPIARDRILAVALVDGRDVARIAVEEGWGVRFVRQPDGSLRGRQQQDWGDRRTPFPDHLPLPEGFSEEDDDP